MPQAELDAAFATLAEAAREAAEAKAAADAAAAAAAGSFGLVVALDSGSVGSGGSTAGESTAEGSAASSLFGPGGGGGGGEAGAVDWAALKAQLTSGGETMHEVPLARSSQHTAPASAFPAAFTYPAPLCAFGASAPLPESARPSFSRGKAGQLDQP